MILKATRSHTLLGKLKRAYQRLGIADGGILLAVSGGVDSSALLLATHPLAPELGIRVEVACLDHGIRPASAHEVTQVLRLSEKLGVRFHTRALRVELGSGLEARARDKRYAALEEIRVRSRLDWIATAHTASDQAETVLMRLARGASTRGAAGIPERRGCIVRPLLGCLRSETERFVQEVGVTPLMDPMNEDPAFLRTRTRLELIPLLTSVAGPKSPLNLARFARLVGEDNAMLDELAADAYARVKMAPGHLSAGGVRALPRPVRRRVLVRLIEDAGVSVDGECIERAMEAVDKGGRATLPRRWVISSTSGVVRCVPPSGPRSQEPHLRLEEGWTFDPASALEIGLLRVRPVQEGLWIEVSDAKTPLWVRRRREGDRVTWGSGRHKKLQDLLTDFGVIAERRDDIPVVCDAQGKIVWVVGVWPPSGATAGQEGKIPNRWYLVAKPSATGLGDFQPGSL